MNAGLPEINFSTIRAWRGSQQKGFEELCVQLFRSRYSTLSKLVRVEGAGGDGGVEAFAEIQNGGFIGLQAKYFLKLGPSQLTQIKSSILTATQNHPQLKEYVVAVPLDRTPAQVRSWNALVKSIRDTRKYGKRLKPMRVTWWGASEITDQLCIPSNKGRVTYWFGSPEFDDAWLDSINAAAKASLDTRYTPQSHVRTDAEDSLEAFARTDRFHAVYLELVGNLLRRWYELKGGFDLQQNDPEHRELVEALTQQLLQLETALGDGKCVPALSGITAAISEVLKTLGKMHDRLRVQDRHAQSEINESALTWTSTPFTSVLYQTRQLSERLNELLAFLQRSRCADEQTMLVLGAAGTGKSHLLAATIDAAKRRHQVSVLLLGEQFRSGEDPITQIVRILSWDGTGSTLLSALHNHAELTNYPALLCIDAVNESVDRGLWRSHLISFARSISEYSNVKLLISCRSDFVGITLPAAVISGPRSWVQVEHTGFGSHLFLAVQKYFNAYQIECDHFPPLLPEFENPLFLKTVCEAFAGRRLPAGPLGLRQVMEARVERLAEKLVTDIDCPDATTHRAINVIADALKRNHGRAVESRVLRPQIDQLFPQGESKSLYKHLVSNGMLTEVCVPSADSCILVRFPFERFSDYFVADLLLSDAGSIDALREHWNDDAMLRSLSTRSGAWANRGLLAALAVILPEKFKIELCDVITNANVQHLVLEAVRDSLHWRAADSFGPATLKAMKRIQCLGAQRFLETLLLTATIPGHPYNAAFLHNRLIAMRLPERELSWTCSISDLVIARHDSTPQRVVKWGMGIPLHTLSIEQARLCAILLLWFCSSNHRGFRSSATVAAIRILRDKPHVAIELLHLFEKCNDPYVTERLFAVVAGVALRQQDRSILSKLASAVHERLFARAKVVPHVLIRDYARSVLEFAAHRNCLPHDISLQSFQPPYRSAWPKILSDVRVEKFAGTEGWSSIASSVKPEPGMYGDFGRYVMQSAVHQFSVLPLSGVAPKHDNERFSAAVARRWVLQRVMQLGWTPKAFGEYEARLPQKGRQHPKVEIIRIERISKKYQWIALHELLGYLTDHYYRASNWEHDECLPVKGAWELWCRDFDPTQPLIEAHDEASDEDECDEGLNDSDRYPDPFATHRGDLTAWVNAKPQPGLEALIEVGGEPHLASDALSLCGFYKWKERLPFELVRSGRGRLEMWTHVRSWLVKSSDLKDLLLQVGSVHFWGNGCSLPRTSHEWIGEFPWAPSYAGFSQGCEGHHSWLKTVRVPIIHTACEFSFSESSAIMPSPQMLSLLKAEWAADDYKFKVPSGNVVAYSRRHKDKGRAEPLLVARDYLFRRLNEAGLSIIWTFVGGRTCWDGEKHVTGTEGEFSAVYSIDRGNLKGGITQHVITDLFQ